MGDFKPDDATLAKLVGQNRAWKRQVDEQDEHFFKESVKGQSPKILWIGCVDSRVPESVILGCMPGEILTHRNIANQLQPNDLGGMSALAFAVKDVGVSHIIVAGHTRCGGVAVCIDEPSPEKDECFAPVDKGRVYGATEPHEISEWPPTSPLGLWLAPLRRLALETGFGPKDLAAENVRQQVRNIAQSDVVREAWTEKGRGRRDLAVHGWMYHLEDGLVQDLNCSVVRAPAV